MTLYYAKHLHLPIKELNEPCMLYNVDRTINKAGIIKYCTNLKVQTGTNHTWMRFFLSNLRQHQVVLGYPWFTAVQPKVDWKRGWIDISQLPIVLCIIDVAKARFLPRKPLHVPKLPKRIDTLYLARVTFEPKEPSVKPKIPQPYQQFTKVFSEEALHEFPPARVWDHAIELKPDAPATLPGKIYPLSQTELQELQKFMDEHLKRGTIRPSKSPYAASFFFIKKKDGKLRPVQDYRPINHWTIRNHYPLPLIPQLID